MSIFKKNGKKVALVYKLLLLGVTAFGAGFGLADWSAVVNIFSSIFG